MSNGEFRKAPGRIDSEVKDDGAEVTERRLLEERGREQAAFLTELLRDPITVPEVGAILVRGEFLVPAEKGGLDISNFEAEPLLKELLKRVGAPAQQEQLTEILSSQKKEEDATVEELEKTIQEAKDAGSTEEALKKLTQRLIKASKARRTDRILRLRVGEVSPEEAKKWLDLYKETKARVRLEQSWKQRVTAATASTKMYAEELFGAAFTAVYPSPSELATIFRIPEIGAAADLALETYLDIHLDRGRFSRLPEERGKLKTLQATESILANQEAAARFVRERCGSNKPWVQESAETLARHYLEFDLTSNWLAVPRDKEGNIDYSRAKKGEKGDFRIGFGLLKGNSQPMGSIWLIFTRLKHLSELSKNRPVGPPALAPGIPEYLAKPLLIFMEVEVDKEGKPHLPSEKPPKGEKWEKKSILEAWYFENKRREEEEYKQPRLPLAKFLECVSENTITYWAYCLFRQSLVRNALVEGDRDKMLAELWIPGALRALGKSFQVAFGERILEREIAKINLVASRIIVWTGPDKENTEIARAGKQEILTSDTWKKYVRNACYHSGFLNEAEWKLVEKVVKKRRALTQEEILAGANKETIKALLREGEKGPIERITKVEPSKEIEKIRKADERVKELQKEIARRSEG